MSFISVNDPSTLPWQTNLFDALMLAMFIAVTAYAVVQYRRGRRIYLAVLVAAIIYGLVLELAGMAVLNMYQQGEFLVMINWTAIPLWEGTTAMPMYVVIFYPVILMTGFKVVEALGITSRWKAAMTGGLFMISLDAPYIIEGNLRHVVWWTWDESFTMFQYWLGWPLVDMFWQLTWDSLFFYLALRFWQHIDPVVPGVQQWSNRKVFGKFSPGAAFAVLIGGTVFFIPAIILTVLGGRQWWLMVVLVAAFAVVAVSALRSARPRRRVEPFTAALLAAYVISFAAMIVGNVIEENGITLYLSVQTLGLISVIGFTVFPLIAGRRRTGAAAMTESAPNRDLVSSGDS